MNSPARTRAMMLLLIAAVSGIHFLSSEPVGSILERADSQLGTPYRRGGMEPGGFDCSGFTSWLYRPTLPNLPRISRDQAKAGAAVPTGEWNPGDLLFYATGTDPSRINHVAVWMGGGKIIHSISDGPETGVVITDADARYWSRRYITARRVLPDTVPEAAAPAIAPPADSPANEIAPVSPEPAEEASPEAASPWEDYDGVMEGDFNLWLESEQEAFEAYKKQNG